ncbi:hypothetical protein HYDPIDRAFT_104926 [Hydnomerulius pinastri MD-312]|nr:hypothetical protein HYDPIDRAFT_104926 [Hydnomerulius pinastri MD-312]
MGTIQCIGAVIPGFSPSLSAAAPGPSNIPNGLGFGFLSGLGSLQAEKANLTMIIVQLSPPLPWPHPIMRAV